MSKVLINNIIYIYIFIIVCVINTILKMRGCISTLKVNIAFTLQENLIITLCVITILE